MLQSVQSLERAGKDGQASTYREETIRIDSSHQQAVFPTKDDARSALSFLVSAEAMLHDASEQRIDKYHFQNQGENT